MIVSWMTTNQCNLKCVHCYQDAEEATERELTTDEAKKMIDEIARAGFKIMIFSGGEPLLRPDIYELVAHAASRGLRPVFGSNGTLITDEVACRLKEAGAAAMGISVSLDAAKHDQFAAFEAHALTMAGIEACKRAGLPFQLHTTVVDWNRDEVCAITDFAEEIGAQAHYIFFLIPVGRGEYIQETSLEVLENEALLREIMEKSAEVSIDVKPTCAPQFTRVAKQLGIDTRFTRGCLAGLTYCVVGSEGIVRPCAYMTEEAGDVRTQPFDEIWKTSPVFERLRTQAIPAPAEAATTRTAAAAAGPAPPTTTTATSWPRMTTAPTANNSTFIRLLPNERPDAAVPTGT
ncbi:MAG: radical SAM protein [Adlercreutzia sp.]